MGSTQKEVEAMNEWLEPIRKYFGDSDPRVGEPTHFLRKKQVPKNSGHEKE